MNTKNLLSIQSVMDEAVTKEKNAGLNILVYKDGKEVCYFESGYSDRENKKSFSRDTICRLYSMTKPVTGVAAWTLIEKGLLELGEPVASYIPAFWNLKTLKDGKVVPSNRPLLIQDLLNMTSGYGYGGQNDAAEKGISELLYAADGLNASCTGTNNITTLQVAERLAAVPTSFEPGTDYMYGMSADILGAVIEVVTGMRYSEYLKKTIFEPLGMKDTAFFVPEEKQHRLSKVYMRAGNWQNPSKTEMTLHTFPNLGIQNTMALDPAFESGGAGLCSTIDDYMTFVRMLTNKGELNGVRILQEKTVEYLASASLRPNLQTCFERRMEHLPGYSYVNLLRVAQRPEICNVVTEKGEFGWDGWLGPYMSVDIKNNLSIVSLTQMTDSGTTDVMRRMKNIIYTSI